MAGYLKDVALRGEPRLADASWRAWPFLNRVKPPLFQVGQVSFGHLAHMAYLG